MIEIEDDEDDDIAEVSSPLAEVTADAEDHPDDEPPRPRGRPSLRVVK
ncbi:stringent starvation protein B [Photobacterium aphoticum]|nr:stringent starvation protein B [Photobacterium aphoticum]